MPRRVHEFAAAFGLFALSDLYGASAAAAATAHPVVVGHRESALLRGGARAPLRMVFAPLHYALRSAETAPPRALPLVTRPQPVFAFPVLLPQAVLASILPELGARADCTAVPSVVKFSVLPAAPFTPRNCSSAATGRQRTDVLPSLVPGRNKDALDGPNISAHDLTDPR